MAENTIDNLSIQITSNADGLERTINRLTSTLSRVRSATSSASNGLRDMAGSSKDVANKMRDVSEETGEARKSFRGLGNDAKNAGDKAKQGTSGLDKFWQSLKRIAFYRAVRSIIRSITDAFKTGITNLYHWSEAINGHFYNSMNRLATASQYLKNSLGAMVSPLIESLIPVLDVVIDKVVEVLNFFNMLVSAISGADTYTVAKKAAAIWDDSAQKTKSSAKSTADELKRTILGFDEINKLVKQTSPSSGSGGNTGQKTPNYKDMFEEKPLEGIFRKISNVTSTWPDWLKWLLGLGGVGIAGWGISQLPKLLGNVLKSLKDLATISLPNWLRNLFGGSGGSGSGSGNYDVDVDLKKGNWDVMDELKNETALVPVGLQHWGWDNIQDWIGTSTIVAVGLRHWGWDNILDWIGTAVTIAVALKKWGWTTLKKWMGADNGVFVAVGLKHWGWNTIEDWIGTAVTVKVGLRRWGWNTIADYIGTSVYVAIGLRHWGWSTISDWIGTAVTVFIGLHKWGWSSLSDFIGTFVNVEIYLNRGNFYSLADWLGDWADVEVYLSRGNFYSLSDWLGEWSEVEVWLTRGNFYSLSDWLGTSVTVRVNLKMGSGGAINASGGSASSSGFGGGKTSGGGAGRNRKALGGIFSNGIWSNIPQYANGTLSAGSLFWAGEAGPEIVGHIGGRTEVLNKSQIASAMYSAVSAAMAPAAANFAQAASYLQAESAPFDMTMLAEMVRQGVETAMERERDIQRQQLDMLRQINDKEFSTDISTSSINSAQRRMNRRAGTTIVPLTT